jgi:Zn-dependent M28 family amino/carboxypeptidase
MKDEMPGKSHRGKLPPLTREEADLAGRLNAHVVTLAGTIGERNAGRAPQLQQAARYIGDHFRTFGYQVREQPYRVGGQQFVNIEAEQRGALQPDEIVVVGAHYDSVTGSPGANDNASGVAALLELSHAMRNSAPRRTVRFVAFVNEEPPYFQTELMGSRVYAAAARRRGENIIAMLSLETIGFYSDAAGSQKYPAPLGSYYPDTGNFIGFVSNRESAWLLRGAVAIFRKTTPFPSEALAAPEFLTGVGWSDQWSFWQEGYSGIMITDTAPFRYPHYHLSSDTHDKLDYGRMARVTKGVNAILQQLREDDFHSHPQDTN